MPESLLCSVHGVILTPEGLHAAAPIHHARRRSGCGLAACFVRAAAREDGADRIFGLRISYGSANSVEALRTGLVCGCRPHEGGAAHTGAGVRKPPMEETAGGVARWRVRRYGDLAAVSGSTIFAIWHELCEGVKTPFAAPVISAS
jgi:hypothetical protein